MSQKDDFSRPTKYKKCKFKLQQLTYRNFIVIWMSYDIVVNVCIYLVCVSMHFLDLSITRKFSLPALFLSFCFCVHVLNLLFCLRNIESVESYIFSDTRGEGSVPPVTICWGSISRAEHSRTTREQRESSETASIDYRGPIWPWMSRACIVSYHVSCLR